MVYIPTFTIKINQMYVYIPYMDPMGNSMVNICMTKPIIQNKNNASRWLNDFLPLPYQTHPARGAHVARRSEGFPRGTHPNQTKMCS